MGKEKRDTEKKSISVDRRIYNWIMDYAREHGMDYTSAVNFLLAEAKKEIERVERMKEKLNYGLLASEPKSSYSEGSEQEGDKKGESATG